MCVCLSNESPLFTVFFHSKVVVYLAGLFSSLFGVILEDSQTVEGRNVDGWQLER